MKVEDKNHIIFFSRTFQIVINEDDETSLTKKTTYDKEKNVNRIRYRKVCGVTRGIEGIRT